MNSLKCTTNVFRLCTQKYPNLQSICQSQPYLPLKPIRHVSKISEAQAQRIDDEKKAKKRRKGLLKWRQHDLNKAEQFSLLDAMRYLPLPFTAWRHTISTLPNPSSL